MKKSLMPKDYKEYLKLQVGRAENKWARKPPHDEIFRQKLLQDWNHIKEYVIEPDRVICMGCRDGTELFEFRVFCPSAKILGVDITENIHSIRVSKVHNVSVRLHDFSRLPKDWGKHFDLVFSNSLDHAYDPYATIREWHRVCRGFLFIQLAIENRPNQIEHCFEETDIPKLFPNDLFDVKEVWTSGTLNIFAEVKG